MDGITEAKALQLLSHRNPLDFNIINYIRDLERGTILDSNGRLERLAKELR